MSATSIDWGVLHDALERSASVTLEGPLKPLGGEAWRTDSDVGPLFVKVASREAYERYAAEALGLQALSAAHAVRVPHVHGMGTCGTQAYLALEWLELRSATPETDRQLGIELAALHKVTAPEHGWCRDNTIGLTPQLNERSPSWRRFFSERRLAVQIELAVKNGFSEPLGTLGARLLEALPDVFGEHEPLPSLLHGDLWGGNYAACDGRPVMYDPAVYFGDRETDLAMTSLFGGFSPAFYEAYREAWPLPPGHGVRKRLYQLYHVLNHVNLFGRSYLAQAIELMRQVLERPT